MKYLPNFFKKGQIKKIFICFPDPHFKAKNHRRRIVSEALLSEYAYCLEPNGLLYTITDVKELHDWHVEKCEAHDGFVRYTSTDAGGDAEQNSLLETDPGVKAIRDETEEGKKVTREGRSKYIAVYRRLPDAEVPKLGARFFDGSGVETAVGGDGGGGGGGGGGNVNCGGRSKKRGGRKRKSAPGTVDGEHPKTNLANPKYVKPGDEAWRHDKGNFEITTDKTEGK